MLLMDSHGGQRLLAMTPLNHSTRFGIPAVDFNN
jgi:hypothetical protein